MKYAYQIKMIKLIEHKAFNPSRQGRFLKHHNTSRFLNSSAKTVKKIYRNLLATNLG